MNGNEPGSVFAPDGEKSPEQLPPVGVSPPQAPEVRNDFYAPTEPSQSPEYAQATAEPIQAHASDLGIEWNASEFVDHQKGFAWFAALGIVTILASAAVYFLTREIFGPIIFVVLAIIFGIGAARKPRLLHYAITPSGIEIENKLYPFTELRSFGLMTVGSIQSIVIMPTKRWQPAINLYVDPEDLENIVGHLDDFLPFEERAVGLADKFLNKIRF